MPLLALALTQALLVSLPPSPTSQPINVSARPTEDGQPYQVCMFVPSVRQLCMPLLALTLTLALVMTLALLVS